jgi:hypothetical protein
MESGGKGFPSAFEGGPSATRLGFTVPEQITVGFLEKEKEGKTCRSAVIRAV